MTDVVERSSGSGPNARTGEAVTYLRELLWILEQVAGIVDSYPPGFLGWRPQTGTANSASAIVNHVSASTRVYALGFGCGQEAERDREAEFQAPEKDASALAADIRTLIPDLEAAFAKLTPVALERRLRPPERLWGFGAPREISAREAIVESIRHAAIHLGELRLTRDLAERQAAGAHALVSEGAATPSAAERYGGGGIVIRDYDPAWPVLFEEERRRILDALGPVVVTIEHVGSTAVPGLAAKPIVDLLVGVRSLAEARTNSIEPMETLGYVYLPEYESWLPGELFFRKGPPGPWTHHAHVMEPSNPRWEEFTLVRDYLRGHGEVAAAYADFKRALATVFGDDIVGFREAKRPFVEAVVRLARTEKAATSA